MALIDVATWKRSKPLSERVVSWVRVTAIADVGSDIAVLGETSRPSKPESGPKAAVQCSQCSVSVSTSMCWHSGRMLSEQSVNLRKPGVRAASPTGAGRVLHP